MTTPFQFTQKVSLYGVFGNNYQTVIKFDVFYIGIITNHSRDGFEAYKLVVLEKFDKGECEHRQKIGLSKDW